MSNTIELLEAIGKDASLRHETGENLAQILARLQASEGLEQAARSGNREDLAHDLGLYGVNLTTHAMQAPIPGEEEDAEEQDEQDDGDAEAPQQ